MLYVRWTNYTAWVSASMIKEVTCEKCKEVYLYALQRTETGTGTSLYGIDNEGAQARAAERAEEHLATALQNAFECVPCPSCGNYQAEMAAFLRRSYKKYLIVYGVCLFMVAMFAGAVGLILQSQFWGATAGIAVIVGISMIIFRSMSVTNFDANAGDPDERKKLAEDIAVLKKNLPPMPPETAIQSAPNPSPRRRR